MLYIFLIVYALQLIFLNCKGIHNKSTKYRRKKSLIDNFIYKFDYNFIEITFSICTYNINK